MGVSSCFSVTTTTIFASSLPNNNNNNSSSNINNKSSSVPTNNQTMPRIKKKNSKKLSVTDVERAIGGGGGNFRGSDPRSNGEEPTFLEKIMTNPFGEEESPVEKKLRETGEWIIEKTEGPSQQAAGQEILLVVCLWILPIWAFSLLVASGVIKLPFSIPFLDNLIM